MLKIPDGGAKRESKEALTQTDSQKHSSELGTNKHSGELDAKNTGRRVETGEQRGLDADTQQDVCILLSHASNPRPPASY
jgi:hypothetical protein